MMVHLRLVLFLTCVATTFTWTRGQTRSCQNTQSTFDNLEVLNVNGQSTRPTGVIFDQLLQKSAGDGVCKLDETCCSGDAENAFKVSTVEDYHSEVGRLLSSLIDCHNLPLFSSIRSYINGSKANLISDMYTAFLFYFQPYEHIFDSFFAYLDSSIVTGDTCQLQLEFNLTSFEVFLAAYIGQNPTTYPDDEDYQQCVYHYFLDSNEISLYNTFHGFTRAFYQLLRYLRGLKMVESIVDSVLSHQLSSRCDDALMKMSYCSQCAGYPASYRPCPSLCVNTMRGCLLDLADLIGPIRELSDALERAKVNLEEIHRPWEQIILLSSRFFQLATTTLRRTRTIQNEVASRCGVAGSGSQSKRQAPSTNRFSRITLVPPLTELNDSAYCLRERLHLFSDRLPQGLCTKNTATTNDNCWTGQTIGSYGRTEIAFNRAAQRDNPEMIICSQQSRFKQDIAKMKYVTRELNSLTQSLECSPDDEDCASFTVLPTCHYYDFTHIDSGPVDSSSASGSAGCSSGDGSTDHCYDPCSDEDSSPSPPSTPRPSEGPTTSVTPDDDTTLEEVSTATTPSGFPGPGGHLTGPTGPLGTVGVEGNTPPIFGTDSGATVLNVSALVILLSLIAAVYL